MIQARPGGDLSSVSLDAPFPPQLAARTDSSGESSETWCVEGFVREHHAFVWRVLRRSGLPPADADDAAQRVFLAAVARREAIVAGSERAFLYRIAVRVASNTRRAFKRRREAGELQEHEEPIDSSSPDELVEQRRARALLDRILDELSEELRAIIILFELEGLRTSEIADALGIPMGTVASRLRRARAEVEQRVARHSARSSSKGGLP